MSHERSVTDIGRPPFTSYQLDTAYDEMFTPLGNVREHYRVLYDRLREMGPSELLHRQRYADAAFLNQGITFTVYGEESGTERIFPYDLLPRIITAGEWATVERGLTQRITALNLFLHDIYHEGRILKDGVVPRELVFTCQHYRREMRGVNVPARHLHHRGGHRPGAPAGRQLRRARGQPAGAQRGQLHARPTAR